MKDLFHIWRIGLYEAKLLFRSWGMRIFSVLGLLIITLLLLVIGTRLGHSPYYFHSFSGSLPLAGMKFYNIFQGIIAAFLASEFFKRDRRHDTTEVIYARSYPNSVYVMGKVSGIISVFAFLNLAALLITFIIHYFFSSTPFTFTPYLLYPLLICLPTLVFIIGLTFMLVSLLRSQAVVFVLMLGISVLSLTLVGSRFFYLFDIYTFYQPLAYSDFIGLGNTSDLLMVRGMYLLLGFALIATTILLFRRLRQSNFMFMATAAVALVSTVSALVLGINYSAGKLADREFRRNLLETSQRHIGTDQVSVKSSTMKLEFSRDRLNVTAEMVLVNGGEKQLDTLLLSLNPGLLIDSLTGSGKEVEYERDLHLITIKPAKQLPPGDETSLTIKYTGNIDERYCYLDVKQEIFETNYRLWLYNIPKQFAFVTDDFLHLTPECGWYPRAGLPAGVVFPSSIRNDYTKYSLSIAVPEDLTAISQGKAEIITEGGKRIFNFNPEVALTQLSVTVADYERKEIEVDGVTYAVNVLRGHDYFSAKLNELGDDLAELISRLKAEYEVPLGIDYPFNKLELVEVPIHFFSHQRTWTLTQESVQPQLIFLPEMGTTCAGGEFHARWGGKKVNVSEKEVHTWLFSEFVRRNLIDSATWERDYVAGGGAVLRVESNAEPNFEIFANYFNFFTRLHSPRWPILNFAMESYLRGRVAEGDLKFARMIGGLSDNEELNLILQDHTLPELVSNPDLGFRKIRAILKLKGNQLLTNLEARLGKKVFRERLTGFLKQHRGNNISESNFLAFIESMQDIKPETIIDSWYANPAIPGYLVERMETFQVIDGEQLRSQVKVKVSNPTAAEGLVKLDIRMEWDKKGGGKSDTGPEEPDYSRAVLIPARTTADLALLLDSPPVMVTVDTIVSQNIPLTMTEFIWEKLDIKADEPVEYERYTPYREVDLAAKGEYLVDSEDPGFEVLNPIRENWLRRTIRRLFNAESKSNRYAGMNVGAPPSNWTLATDQDFYGKFVRSGYYKKAGDGSSKVAWSVNLPEAGEYEIFHYYVNSLIRLKSTRRRKGSKPVSGFMDFTVLTSDGTEDVTIDLKNMDNGWNLIGTFSLSAGENRVELSDKNDLPYVLADAIKWVKR